MIRPDIQEHRSLHWSVRIRFDVRLRGLSSSTYIDVFSLNLDRSQSRSTASALVGKKACEVPLIARLACTVLFAEQQGNSPALSSAASASIGGLPRHVRGASHMYFDVSVSIELDDFSVVGDGGRCKSSFET